jgi:3-oxoacyl-[acyl-carrier-protein] synthase II
MSVPAGPMSGVAVTGVGLVTPLGLSSEIHLERSCRGESAISSISRFDTGGFAATAGAQVPDFDLQNMLRQPKAVKFMSLPVQCAVMAAYEAVQHSRLETGQVAGERIAVHTGSGQTGLEYAEFFQALSLAWEGEREYDYKYLGGRPSRLIDRYFSLRTLSNAGLALVSAELEAKGPASNFVQSDTASAMALLAAAWDLLEDRCDLALVCGYDALLKPGSYLAFEKAGLLSTLPPSEAYRPFDARRDGLVLGEGACCLVLERVESAEARGVPILAELLGVGTTTETEGPPGMPRCVRTFERSIKDCGVDVAGVDFVVARGLGTPADDHSEASALAAIFDSCPPITSFKSATGYLGAATAAVEFGMGLLCAYKGFLPPIPRLTQPDSAFNLPFIAGQARQLSRPDSVALFFSSSWGGQMAVVAARVGQRIPAA